MYKKILLNLLLLGSALFWLSGCSSDSGSANDGNPQANAGANKLINLASGSKITLDGSQSTDNNSSSLSYKWSFSSMPDNSNANISNSNSVTSSFFADVMGVYSAELLVTDEEFNTSTSIVEIVVMPVLAYSGPDRSVKTGSTVQLDGIFTLEPNLAVDGSLTFDSENVSFLWKLVSMPSGSTASITDTAIINPTFVADLPGEYVVKLEVDDGYSVTTDEIQINALDLKAMAGMDQFYDIDATVQLDGSESWNLNGDISYTWSFVTIPEGSTAIFSDASIVNPTFTADAEGEYTINLTVSDGVLENSDEVYVIVIPGIDFPVDVFVPYAFIGFDRTVKTGSSIQLDGSASLCGHFDGALPEGPAFPGCTFTEGDISFAWSFVSIPAGSSAVISDVNALSPTFIADIEGDYVVKLALDDGTQVTTDEAVITAADLHANAGYDQIASLDGTVQLDGTQSWNINGEVFYNWSFISIPEGSTAVLADVNAATPTFTPDLEGGYELELVINDGGAKTSSATTLVHAFDFSFPPGVETPPQPAPLPEQPLPEPIPMPLP